MRGLTLQDTAFVASLAGKRKPEFGGGNLSFGSLKELVEELSLYKDANPSAGGTLTVNEQSLSSYDYCIKNGNFTVSNFSASDWFTSTKDTRSAIIVVDGNLTINEGQTFIPPVRKLFTVLYVTKSLTVNGEISMTARGANHNGTGDSGGAVTAKDIRIATGEFSGVTNPQIPAAGGNGGAGITQSSKGNTPGNPGSNGTNGGTGGGGGGSTRRNNYGTAVSGAGTAGTCFTGGTGGGGAQRHNLGTSTAGAGTIRGGAGGNGAGEDDTHGVSGGVGNPHGSSFANAPASEDGTGGTIVIFVKGALKGTGSITSQGKVSGGSTITDACGGSSGGGSINILCGSEDHTLTISAAGGIATPVYLYSPGGKGGDGTARILAL